MRQTILLLIFVLCKRINCQSNSKSEEVSSKCKDEDMTNYLAEIEITCPESVIELAVENLETLCRRVCEQLEKFHKYIKACKTVNRNDLYMSLISGVKTLQSKLCDTPEFSRRFELYYPCLHELRNDFEGCNGPTDWYEEKNEEVICKTYKHILDCYFIKTAKVCGLDSAKTLKELMTEVVDSVISAKCGDIEDPEVKDPMPENYLCGKAETEQSSITIIIYITFLRLYLI